MFFTTAQFLEALAQFSTFCDFGSNWPQCPSKFWIKLHYDATKDADSISGSGTASTFLSGQLVGSESIGENGEFVKPCGEL